MAVYSAKNLVVLHGSNTLTHVRSASVSPSIDTVEVTAAADTAKSFITTTMGFEASVDLLEDDTTSLTDTELVVGTSGALKIRPEGTGSGLIEYSGTALVTGYQHSSPYDGVVAISVSFLGTTALTSSVQP